MVRPGGPEVGQLAPRAPVLPQHLHRPRRLLGEAASHDDGCEVAMLTQRTVTSDQVPTQAAGGGGAGGGVGVAGGGPGVAAAAVRAHLATAAAQVQALHWRNLGRLYSPQKNAEVCQGFG